MGLFPNPGELKTKVYFCNVTHTTDANGYDVATETDAFDSPRHVKWVNAHGSDVFAAEQMQLNQPATLTLRYSPNINEKQILYKGARETVPYEIISIDDIRELHKWMEIKVQRRVMAD